MYFGPLLSAVAQFLRRWTFTQANMGFVPSDNTHMKSHSIHEGT